MVARQKGWKEGRGKDSMLPTPFANCHGGRAPLCLPTSKKEKGERKKEKGERMKKKESKERKKESKKDRKKD